MDCGCKSFTASADDPKMCTCGHADSRHTEEAEAVADEPASDTAPQGQPGAAAPAVVPAAASTATPPTDLSAALTENERLRAENASMRRSGIELTARATIEAAVRDLKMPALPVATKDGAVHPETLSSLLMDSLVESQLSSGCSTCQANHGRTVKVISLLPPVAPSGRLPIK